MGMGNVRLTRGAKVAATASEADGRAGDAGPQAGPRKPSGGLAAARWRGWPVASWAGCWSCGLGRAAGWEAFFSSSFSIFHFFSICLNSNLV